MFILQQQQGTGAYDLAKFSWIGTMGEGERYMISVGAKSPLKSFADLKTLSAKRPVKFSVTGPEGTAYAATMIGTQLLGIRTQLISGYKGSADYVIAAIRGDSDAVIAAIPTTLRFARGGQLRVLASFETQSSIREWYTAHWLRACGRSTNDPVRFVRFLFTLATICDVAAGISGSDGGLFLLSQANAAARCVRDRGPVHSADRHGGRDHRSEPIAVAPVIFAGVLPFINYGQTTLRDHVRSQCKRR